MGTFFLRYQCHQRHSAHWASFHFGECPGPIEVFNYLGNFAFDYAKLNHFIFRTIVLLSVGTKVSFKNTKDEGIVTGFLDTGMVRIKLLDSGMEIPAFVDDLIRLSDPVVTAKAKIVPAKKDKPILAPATESQTTEPKKYTLTNTGLHLVFIPDGYQLNEISRYGIYLVNDTPDNLSFSIACHLKDKLHFKRNARLNSGMIFHLGALDFTQLNDTPCFSSEIWQLTGKGSSGKTTCTLKLKPRSFFKNQTQVPFLDTTGYAFPIIEIKPPNTLKKQGENLRDYTKKHIPEGKSFNTHRYTGSLKEFQHIASFPTEIDLHIEKLVVDSKKIGKKSVLQIQLQHFEAYLDKAIQLGIERVFIIHGLGEGKLRDAIAERLSRYRGVKTFKNEFHPRYGFGATEVILK